MDLKSGFKMTELGPLPEDWEVVRLGEILEESREIVQNSTLPNTDRLPVLSLTKNYGLILQNERFDKRIATEDISKYKIVHKGQIVYNPYVIWEGAIHILKKYEAGIVSPVYIVLSTKQNKADPYFLDAWLRTPFAIEAYNRFASGAVNRRRAIRKKDFWNIKIPLPPLPEQKAIAGVLKTIQDAMEATERVIAAAKELKKSLMRHLFTYGPVPVSERDRVRLKQTEIGPIPEDWEVVRLGGVGSFQYGYTEKAVWEEIGPKFLRITDIDLETGFINWEQVPYCKISDGDFSKFKLKKGDILIARIGATTGKTCIITSNYKAVFASYLIKFSPSDKLDNLFAFYFTQTKQYWDQIQGNKEGKLKKGVSAKLLSRFFIPLPPLPVQQKIAQILKAVDDKIEAEEKKKEALQAFFKTMLHHLMTGKIRVKCFSKYS